MTGPIAHEPPQRVARSALHHALREAEERTLEELAAARDWVKRATDAAAAGEPTAPRGLVDQKAELEAR